MTNAKITIAKRDENKNPRQIRQEGFLPGSIYGKGIEATSFQTDAHEFEMAYKNNQDSTWELKLDKNTYNAKIQELQINHATGEFLNVEFVIA